jgi:hypothetical protein
MLKQIQRTWSEVKAGKPGQRFRDHYKRRNHPARHGALRKTVTIAGGGALIAVGIVGLVLPGPGVLAIALGCALISTESYFAAKAMDVLELGARHAIRSLLHR